MNKSKKTLKINIITAILIISSFLIALSGNLLSEREIAKTDVNGNQELTFAQYCSETDENYNSCKNSAFTASVIDADVIYLTKVISIVGSLILLSAAISYRIHMSLPSEKE